jgi:glutamyl/glutaminyl-tRNA synthetase
MIEMDTLTLVRWRLTEGRTIADSDVHKLVAQIDQLKAYLSEAIERGDDWCDQAKKARAERDAAKLQTAEAVVALNNRDRERMQAEREAREAADEIERLRADVTRCKESLEMWDTYAGDIIDDRNRLRVALERAANTLSDSSLLDAWADARRAALKETGHD